LAVSPIAAADDRDAPWPGGFVARLEALSLIETLNADLLSHNSATATLKRWCADHHIAEPAEIVAVRVRGADKPASDAQRQLLAVSATEVVKYRRVKLVCGSVVLSEADNWYVPSRLTAAMNTMLDTTDTPFGRAVEALHFQRHTLSAELLWSPLPRGWEMSASIACDGVAQTMPSGVLRHTAVLSLPDGEPLSEVIETYTNRVLTFAHPLPGIALGKMPPCS
jgi:chorismate-pyruvate lyase